MSRPPRKCMAHKSTRAHARMSRTPSSRSPATAGGPRLKRTRRSSPSSSTTSIPKEKSPTVSREVRPGCLCFTPPQGMGIHRTSDTGILGPRRSTRHASSSASDTIQVVARSSANVTTILNTTSIEWRLPSTDYLYVLNRPISLCTRFATWIENQIEVDHDVLLRTVERDGAHFLRLAKAALSFDNALRGHVPAEVALDDPLREHARTLRMFAELLQSKVAESTLSAELQVAVLRDGEIFFRLAVLCLEL